MRLLLDSTHITVHRCVDEGCHITGDRGIRLGAIPARLRGSFRRGVGAETRSAWLHLTNDRTTGMGEVLIPGRYGVGSLAGRLGFIPGRIA